MRSNHPALVMAIAAALAGAAAGCRSKTAGTETPHAEGAAPAAEEESWSVTTWGEKFEIFPETRPLVAGAAAPSHTHVTILAGFAPLREGSVSAVLRGPGGEQAFSGRFKRDGIFEIELRPAREGIYDLGFRIDGPAGREEIPSGKVKVGTASSPGGLVEPPKPPFGTVSPEGEQEISFLKEQQWKTEFATEWVREGEVPATVRGPARIRPAAGGEVVLTAPVDAVVAPDPWPHQGRAVSRGAAVFRLLPAVSTARSLPELRGDMAALQAEAAAAQARAERLDGLLKVNAISRAEVERARASAASLEARLTAARSDLAAAAAARTGQASGALLPVPAPWNGVVAAVQVSPGQSVAAGTALGRLVKAAPIWLEVALRPEDAARVTGGITSLHLRRPADPEPFALAPAGVRLVSRAPEVDPRTGTRAVILEVAQSAEDFPIGTVAEAELSIPGGGRGTVIPGTALVDDGGATVVYVQLSGEGFARREVRVVGRAGAQVAVEGLRPGERLVSRGGASIRRASLLSTGAPEGHVH